MMRPGIFARTYTYPTLDQTLDAVARDGINAVHFNLKCAGVDAMPDLIETSFCQTIHNALKSRGLEMIGLSGTFNAIHPDPSKRTLDTERCKQLIAHAPALGTELISLCTGTRDRDNMWRAHPDNNTPEAWRALLTTLEQLLPVAQEHHVVLGVEPECANVINTAAKARRLLDELGSKNLKIIMDGANLFEPGQTDPMQDRLTEAFDLLGDDLIQVHAKDIPTETKASSQAAGTGCLDWDTYFTRIGRSGYQGPIVLHNLSPDQVPDSRDFVRRHINDLTLPAP